MASTISFPHGFIWGTATAAYQIEGAANEGGRGESIWDRFSRSPGNTRNGETGDIACDHYHRWREDVSIMRDLGVNAYRFSIAWPRIFPDGDDRLNPAGLDFYATLVEALLDAGIRPFATLYHWDLPQPLEDAGGWPARPTAYAFADYAAAVADRLGDRIEDWWTINEPWVVATMGYTTGVYAPGRKDVEEGRAAAHHLLLGHGLAAQAIHAVRPDARVGIVTNADAMVPRSAHPADRRAAEEAHGRMSRWYLDPVLLGRYPEDVVAHVRWDQAPVFDGDLEIISTPIDHVGVNYYSRRIVADGTIDDAERPSPIVEADLPRTTKGWEVYPTGLTELLTRYDDDYDLPPVYITESGAAFPDEVADGRIDDRERVEYLARHFAAARDAIDAGVPLSGYFVWSLLDNFEWAEGYSQRFGLVYVDYDTQQRTTKRSGYWFRDFISSGGILPDPLEPAT
jgi:beta-glucosidase